MAMDASGGKVNAAVLVGNGLSVAVNPELNLRTITQELVDRIGDATADGSDVVAAMKEIAERALPSGASSDGDFEILVGAFGAESRTLSYLHELASLVSPQDEELRSAIKQVSEFAKQVRDEGLSHVLEVIFERSQGWSEGTPKLHEFVEAITTAFDGKIAVGNLNYDTLLLSALLTKLDRSELADMGHGYKKCTITADDRKITVPVLRASASDFPINRVRLLHLHGSLTYWSDMERTVFAKVDTAHLSEFDQWGAIRERRTNVRPVVVLANQRDKSEHVTQFPFSVAYEAFEEGLKASSHWLVVGYSFRDVCVNDMLRKEFSNRTDKPSVLVVTYGEQPSEHDVERAFGWGAEDGDSSGWLTVNRGGANDMKDSLDWRNFIPLAATVNV
jgi:hypothetical protein